MYKRLGRTQREVLTALQESGGVLSTWHLVQQVGYHALAAAWRLENRGLLKYVSRNGDSLRVLGGGKLPPRPLTQEEEALVWEYIGKHPRTSAFWLLPKEADRG